MDPLALPASSETPEILFDPAAKTFLISGNSYPEDAAQFYRPVLQWLEGYITHPLPETHFQFKLHYFNTASSKQVFKILMLLKNLSQQSTLKISWYYHTLDKDMKKAGKRYASLIQFPIEIIEEEQRED